MKKILIAAACALSLAACATRPNVALQSRFDEAATAAQMKPGANTIKGSALFRQQGGGVVTCAGFPIVLFPATPYSKERITAIYGSPEGGLSPVYKPQPMFQPDPPVYKTMIKETRCDAQGFFKIENLSDGEYFIQSAIAWQAGYAAQGGTIVAFVKIQGAETKEVVLAR